MKNESSKISSRLLDYGNHIIDVCTKLDKTIVGRHIGNQLLRSGTSVGANYEEACGAQSRADFIHKLQIVMKEVRESLYWLKLIERSKIIKPDIYELIDETEQISNIIGKSIITAKKRQ